MPAASLRTGLALTRMVFRSAPAGRADAVPFRERAVGDPAERARRVTALLAASLAPASYVVRMDPGRAEVLLHGIDSRPQVHDREWLA